MSKLLLLLFLAAAAFDGALSESHTTRVIAGNQETNNRRGLGAFTKRRSVISSDFFDTRLPDTPPTFALVPKLSDNPFFDVR